MVATCCEGDATKAAKASQTATRDAPERKRKGLPSGLPEVRSTLISPSRGEAVRNVYTLNSSHEGWERKSQVWCLRVH